MGETEEDKKVTEGGSVNEHLANERTFLAWIRTAVAIMAFGFVVVKFSLFVKQLPFLLSQSTELPSAGYSAYIGTGLVAFGGLISLLAFFRYKRIEKELKANTFFPSSTLIITLTIMIVLGCIFLMLYLIPGII